MISDSFGIRPIGRKTGINQILEYNNTLYILNDADGTIRIYDLEGNYIGTIAFHITSINGSFQESVNGDVLYVIDRSSNVYIFKNGDFTGKYILPGFIDTHIHGAYGARISDSNCELDKIADIALKEYPLYEKIVIYKIDGL